MATDECTYVSWTAEALGAVLRSDAFLGAVVFNLVGEYNDTDRGQDLTRPVVFNLVGEYNDTDLRAGPDPSRGV